VVRGGGGKFGCLFWRWIEWFVVEWFVDRGVWVVKIVGGVGCVCFGGGGVWGGGGGVRRGGGVWGGARGEVPPTHVGPQRPTRGAKSGSTDPSAEAGGRDKWLPVGSGTGSAEDAGGRYLPQW